jgi:hypothetical protein
MNEVRQTVGLHLLADTHTARSRAVTPVLLPPHA